MKVWELVNVFDMSSITFLTITNKEEDICYAYDSAMDDLNKVKKTCPLAEQEVEKVTIISDCGGEWLNLIIVIR